MLVLVQTFRLTAFFISVRTSVILLLPIAVSVLLASHSARDRSSWGCRVFYNSQLCGKNNLGIKRRHDVFALGAVKRERLLLRHATCPVRSCRPSMPSRGCICVMLRLCCCKCLSFTWGGATGYANLLRYTAQELQLLRGPTHDGPGVILEDCMGRYCMALHTFTRVYIIREESSRSNERIGCELSCGVSAACAGWLAAWLAGVFRCG